MRPLGKAVIRAGLVDDSTLSELRRWGLPVQVADAGVTIEDAATAVRVLQDALESGDQVRMQDTDLDIVQRWLDPANQVTGKLVLHADEQKSTSKVIFCWTVMHEVAFPWKSDSIEDLLLGENSYLQYVDPKTSKEHRCFFSDVRELYIGDTKAFLVCALTE
mgnify:FL=1